MISNVIITVNKQSNNVHYEKEREHNDDILARFVGVFLIFVISNKERCSASSSSHSSSVLPESS
jgi:hypothetical protein